MGGAEAAAMAGNRGGRCGSGVARCEADGWKKAGKRIGGRCCAPPWRTVGVLEEGLQNTGRVFPKIAENRRNRTRRNLKAAEFTVHYFKISETDKNQKNICKKLDWILRLLVKKFL
jgi:hypothetical protein